MASCALFVDVLVAFDFLFSENANIWDDRRDAVPIKFMPEFLLRVVDLTRSFLLRFIVGVVGSNVGIEDAELFFFWQYAQQENRVKHGVFE